MRYLLIIVAILLFLAGSATFFYWSQLSVVWSPLLIVFLERALWRLVYRFWWFAICIPLMSQTTRHAYEHLLLAGKHACVAYGGRVKTVWEYSPWPIRALLAILGAFLAGFTAFALFILPVHVGKIPFIGGWLRETGLPYLMRSATAKSIELNLPPAWMSMPAHIRQFFKRPYMRLWWWTARRLVKSRQALGKRAAKLHHKKVPAN